MKKINAIYCVGIITLYLGLCACNQSTSASPTNGVFTLESSFPQGTNQINGTIHFGQSLPAGTAVILAYVEGTPSSAYVGNELKSFTLSAAASSVNYNITKLGAASYSVWARADVNGNGAFESGDLGGYYVSDPNLATTYNNATLIDMSSITSAEAVIHLSVLQ